ncbi:MAG: nucleotidyltransferase domain-containing protein [Candidatus Methanoperedens sp.]|nr:nucleotidyltransferase domain-containing protein [Candidatus Methanoperedens sp.]
MLQKYTTYRVLTLFFDYHTRHFQLREISRMLKLGMPSVINHVKILEKESLIKKEKRGVYESYISEKNDLFRTYRRNDILLRIHESGLIDFLADELMPDAIVLFGSCARGEDIETSDVDLLVVAKEKEVDLKKFESALKRKISLHFEENVSQIPKELLNNIVNGIVVYGYLTVFQ